MDQQNPLRLGRWLLLVSATLFVFAIAFVIAGVRTRVAATAAPPPPVVETRPVATVKQIMQGLVIPASSVLYEAVSYTADASGVKETKPQTDDDWNKVATAAAMLAEAGNLLMMEGHAVDREHWVTHSRELIDASQEALKAARARDAEGVLNAGSTVTEACDRCHDRYSP